MRHGVGWIHRWRSGRGRQPHFGGVVPVASERQQDQSGVWEEDYWVVKLAPKFVPATADTVVIDVVPALNRNVLADGVRLSLIGISNRMHLTEYSMDLVAWNPLSTNLIGDKSIEIVDKPARANTFYRARALAKPGD